MSNEPNTAAIIIVMASMLLALPLITMIKNPPKFSMPPAVSGKVTDDRYPYLGFSGRLITDPAAEILDASGSLN